MKPDIEAIAQTLDAAFASATQVPPITSTHPGFDVDTAYEVLARLHDRHCRRGWRPIGRKIGFTNVTIWQRYGVDRPMWSHVWDRSVRFAGSDAAPTLSLDGLMEPRIEPEVVFRLAKPLPRGADPAALLDALEWIAPGFEIVHSVFPGWRFAAADCAAALGLHGRLVVGTPVVLDDDNRGWFEQELPTFEATLLRGDERVDTGRGANVLGSPLKALARLRDLLATQPAFPPLAAGEIVTTGTLTDAWPVASGQVWSSRYGTLGIEGLTLRFS